MPTIHLPSSSTTRTNILLIRWSPPSWTSTPGRTNGNLPRSSVPSRSMMTPLCTWDAMIALLQRNQCTREFLSTVERASCNPIKLWKTLMVPRPGQIRCISSIECRIPTMWRIHNGFTRVLTKVWKLKDSRKVLLRRSKLLNLPRWTARIDKLNDRSRNQWMKEKQCFRI